MHTSEHMLVVGPHACEGSHDDTVAELNVTDLKRGEEDIVRDGSGGHLECGF